MAVLKYKNGSTWESLNFATKDDLNGYATKDDVNNIATGPTLEDYPIKSLYIGPGSFGNRTEAAYCTTINNSPSPASFLGGSWGEASCYFNGTTSSTQGMLYLADSIGYYRDSPSQVTSYTYGFTVDSKNYKVMIFKIWYRIA